MRLADTVSSAVFLVAGTVGGVLVGGPIAIVAGTLVGAGLAVAALFLRVRPLVASSVAGGGLAGLFVGISVIRVLCLPDTCPGLETFGGIVTAAGAVVGVGVVVALATRSFDEYHEAIRAGVPPPEPGCETDQDGHD